MHQLQNCSFPMLFLHSIFFIFNLFLPSSSMVCLFWSMLFPILLTQEEQKKKKQKKNETTNLQLNVVCTTFPFYLSIDWKRMLNSPLLILSLPVRFSLFLSSECELIVNNYFQRTVSQIVCRRYKIVLRVEKLICTNDSKSVLNWNSLVCVNRNVDFR